MWIQDCTCRSVTDCWEEPATSLERVEEKCLWQPIGLHRSFMDLTKNRRNEKVIPFPVNYSGSDLFTVMLSKIMTTDDGSGNNKGEFFRFQFPCNQPLKTGLFPICMYCQRSGCTDDSFFASVNMYTVKIHMISIECSWQKT